MPRKEISVTAEMKGSFGESLLIGDQSAVRGTLTDWFLSELESEYPEWIPDAADDEYLIWLDQKQIHSYNLSVDGTHLTWRPDVVYRLGFRPRDTTFEEYFVEFPAEIKTGEYAELERDQRAVMATIEQQDTPIFPVRVKVFIDSLPDSFEILPHRVTHTGDGPLPGTKAGDDWDDPPTVPSGQRGNGSGEVEREPEDTAGEVQKTLGGEDR